MQAYGIAAFGAIAFLGATVPAFPDTCTPNLSSGFFSCISQPDPLYTSVTTRIDFSTTTVNRMNYDSISGGGLMIDFSIPLMRLTVPGSWGTWNCPPATEAVCPQAPPTNPRNLPVLFTNGPETVTLTLSSAEATFGFEVQPDLSDIERITAIFFDASGMRVGTITRDVSGNGGALLFAGSSSVSFKTVMVTDSGPGGTCPATSVCDFAIANPRFGLTAIPEPAPALLAFTSLAALQILRLLRAAARKP
jgi:hypothetical protein